MQMNELLPCPFCGGEARTSGGRERAFAVWCTNCGAGVNKPFEETAIAAWNSRAELGSKPPYDELLRCLENDWNIRASWDGLRKFWSIELTEEGVRLRDAELNSRAERTCHDVKPSLSYFKCDSCGMEDMGGTELWIRDGFYRLQKPNYCPNCGAKIIGG